MPADGPPPAEPASSAEAEAVEEAFDAVEKPALVDRRVDLAVATSGVAIGLLLIFSAEGIRQGSIPDPIGPGGMLIIFGAGLAAAAAFLVVQRLLTWRRTGPLVESDGGAADEPGFPASWWRPWVILAAAWGWGLLAPRIGYTAATFLLSFVIIALMRVRTPVKLIVVPLLFSVLTWLMFDRAFGIRLPVGAFEYYVEMVIPRLT